MDFQFELGKTLDGTLRLFAKKNLCAENIISRRSVTREVAKETLFALYNRGCIANLERKTYESAEKIELADRFRITVEGRDFIELHAKWWARFWFRSIVCPVVVSFVTALNAVKILNVFKGIWRLLISP